MSYDTDPDHLKSEVILWRQVVNDAVVGPWQELVGVREHTEVGLKEWMRSSPEGWAPEFIEPGGFDHRLRNYGLRLQFWIPDTKPIIGAVVVCDDACGVSLTEDKEYSVVAYQDGLYEVEDDAGERRAFFKERFHRIKQMCTM
jgi:hypothetical protein